MGIALWLTLRVGRLRIPLPLFLLLPLFMLLDLIAFVVLIPYGLKKKEPLLLDIGAGFCLTRLAVGLILYGGGLEIDVRDGNDRVRISEGLSIDP